MAETGEGRRSQGDEATQNGLRVVHRTIVSAYVLSEDDFMLMGRQDPAKGGTWPHAWRILGGGVRDDESRRKAMTRELSEEAIGLEVDEEELVDLALTAKDEHEKTLESGETVWQVMDFHHFALRLGGAATGYAFRPGGDIIELRWFDREERATIPQIPIGKDMMFQAGFIDRHD